MSQKERTDYERMRLALKRIATGYMTLKQIERDAEKRIGLSYGEVLEMAYENIRDDAREAVRGVRTAIAQQKGEA
ncbi:hypothetical protein YH64_009125 [Achromobacter sp. LC458]|uniref:hypothetical protein n=1 Tax=Achromobacter sp. LC458 TaxID=1120623 RepID=UPI0011703A75|nr:hypothetical protein [Achromobacter sp. LC458]TRM53252.1 hypothetical protein YH64_009125 [Achromobacter sp. LC458]